MPVRRFFTQEQEEAIIKAIQEAETSTSGEIRVHIEARSKKDTFKRAIEVFEELGMHATDLRNGVLFYLATEDHKFTILGDKGINESVPKGFWDNIRDVMGRKFQSGDFTSGLTEGISMAGKALGEFFPYQDDDENELPDQISTSDQ